MSCMICSPAVLLFTGILYIGYYKAWFITTKRELPIEVSKEYLVNKQYGVINIIIIEEK